MATIIKVILDFGENERWFITSNDKIIVLSSEEGIATVTPTKDLKNFQSFLNILMGCLEEKSNFNFFFHKYYGEDIKGFKFFLDRVDYLVTPHSDIDAICTSMNKNHILEQKDEYRRQQLHEKVLKLDETTKIHFKDESAEIWWNCIVDNAKTNKKLQLISFTERYAKIMQYLIEKHGINNLRKYSARIIYAINKDGIVETSVISFTFDTLRKIWKYGDKL